MKKFLFISASIAMLGIVDSAQAQYGYAPPPGYGGAAGPQYYGAVPQYVPTPQYAPSVGRAAPGSQWREDRAQGDWRNNTWREKLQQDDWRTNNWRERRANEDWREREGYAKQRTKNNAADRGYVECGVGAVGSSIPCRGYEKPKTKTSAEERIQSVECGPNSVAESCRSRRDESDSDSETAVKNPHLDAAKKQNPQQ